MSVSGVFLSLIAILPLACAALYWYASREFDQLIQELFEDPTRRS